jgi:hypothetical protein
MAVEKIEICANCGKINKAQSEEFKCADCGCDVCVVISRDIFLQMVKAGLAKE